MRDQIHALSTADLLATGARHALIDGHNDLVLEATTMDRLVFRAFDLQETLRKRITGGMPVYGSCASMIILADRIANARPDRDTLGGLDITVRRHTFGRRVDSFEEVPHFLAVLIECLTDNRNRSAAEV